MNLLILPGNSPKHAQWADELASQLTSYFAQIEIQHYRHWQNGEEWADSNHEIAVAKNTTAGLKPFAIIAKSIGTVIAVQGTADGNLTPEKIILLGVPISGVVEKESFNNWLEQIDIPVTIAQNTSDPFGSFDDVTEAFKNTQNNITFIELPGTTHDYSNYESLKKII